MCFVFLVCCVFCGVTLSFFLMGNNDNNNKQLEDGAAVLFDQFYCWIIGDDFYFYDDHV